MHKKRSDNKGQHRISSSTDEIARMKIHLKKESQIDTKTMIQTEKSERVSRTSPIDKGSYNEVTVFTRREGLD